MNRKGLLFITVVSILFATQAFAAETIRYNGSSTIMKAIMYDAAKQFEQEEGVSIDLKGKSTGYGIKKLLAGECDFAGGGRTLKPEEKAMGLEEFPIFRDGCSVIVHSSNPVGKISKDQLAGILRGEITSWDQLGGPSGKKIIIISPPGDSSHFKNAQKLLGFDKLPNNAMSMDMTPDVYSKVKTFPLSIGWLSVSTINGKNDIKTIKIDGGAASGEFLYTKSMYFYTKGAPGSEVNNFMKFLEDDRGREIITRAGFLLAR
jgi:phosphate transport system substrate-binding protein